MSNRRYLSEDFKIDIKATPKKVDIKADGDEAKEVEDLARSMFGDDFDFFSAFDDEDKATEEVDEPIDNGFEDEEEVEENEEELTEGKKVKQYVHYGFEDKRGTGPIDAMSDTPDGLAKKLGMTTGSVKSNITHGRPQFAKVEYDEDDEFDDIDLDAYEKRQAEKKNLKECGPIEEGSVKTIQSSGYDFTDTFGNTGHFYTIADPDTDLTSYHISDGVDEVSKDSIPARKALREILDFIKSHLKNREDIFLAWNEGAKGDGDLVVSVYSKDKRSGNYPRTLSNWAEAERMIRNALHLHNRPMTECGPIEEKCKKKLKLKESVDGPKEKFIKDFNTDEEGIVSNSLYNDYMVVVFDRESNNFNNIDFGSVKIVPRVADFYSGRPNLETTNKILQKYGLVFETKGVSCTNKERFIKDFNTEDEGIITDSIYEDYMLVVFDEAGNNIDFETVKIVPRIADFYSGHPDLDTTCNILDKYDLIDYDYTNEGLERRGACKNCEEELELRDTYKECGNLQENSFVDAINNFDFTEDFNRKEFDDTIKNYFADTDSIEPTRVIKPKSLSHSRVAAEKIIKAVKANPDITVDNVIAILKQHKLTEDVGEQFVIWFAFVADDWGVPKYLGEGPFNGNYDEYYVIDPRKAHRFNSLEEAQTWYDENQDDAFDESEFEEGEYHRVLSTNDPQFKRDVARHNKRDYDKARYAKRKI